MTLLSLIAKQQQDREPLPIGQVVSYGDHANSRTPYVVVSEPRPGGWQDCINTATLHRSEVSRAAIEGPGGFRLEDDDPYTLEEIEDLKTASLEQLQEEKEERDRANRERETKRARGRKIYEQMRPAWAKSYIVAYLKQSECDSMTDYFASSTVRGIFLGWSKSTRNSFSEMRKAAATRPETAHMGPGKDIYTPRIVHTEDIASNGRYYHKGEGSHWHSDEGYNSLDPATFTTEEEAQAHIDQHPAPHTLSFDGVTTHFEWRIDRESIEHRENYSGGKGYYLGTASYHGWQISKLPLDYGPDYDLFADMEEPAKPAKVQVSIKSEQIRVKFPAKPAKQVRLDLRSAGMDWDKETQEWFGPRDLGETVANLLALHS